MTKQQTIKLFRKLFEKDSRTFRNWSEMIDSLEKEGVLTVNQAAWRKNAWYGQGGSQIAG